MAKVVIKDTWLKDENGNPIAPKTLTEQIIDRDGKRLDERIVYGDGSNDEIPILVEDEVAKIKNEGERQLGSINDAGVKHAKTINDAGTEQISAVTAEGTKQKKLVEDAANGIVADREQITQNKNDILFIKNALKEKGIIV